MVLPTFKRADSTSGVKIIPNHAYGYGVRCLNRLRMAYLMGYLY